MSAPRTTATAAINVGLDFLGVHRDGNLKRKTKCGEKQEQKQRRNKKKDKGRRKAKTKAKATAKARMDTRRNKQSKCKNDSKNRDRHNKASVEANQSMKKNVFAKSLIGR